MFDEDLVAKRAVKPRREPQVIGARDAERILGISRAALNRLAKTGRLPGTLADKPGVRRSWQFEVADVLRVKQEGNALRRPPGLRRIEIALSDLREILFNTLDALHDKENPMDVDRANAIANVANVLVNSARAEYHYLEIVGSTGTGFIPEAKEETLTPATTDLVRPVKRQAG